MNNNETELILKKVKKYSNTMYIVLMLTYVALFFNIFYEYVNNIELVTIYVAMASTLIPVVKETVNNKKLLFTIKLVIPFVFIAIIWLSASEPIESDIILVIVKTFGFVITILGILIKMGYGNIELFGKGKSRKRT